jgi:hypothetical protein
MEAATYLASHVCRSNRIGAGGRNCQYQAWSQRWLRSICHAARGCCRHLRATFHHTRGLQANDPFNRPSQYSLVR